MWKCWSAAPNPTTAPHQARKTAFSTHRRFANRKNRCCAPAPSSAGCRPPRNHQRQQAAPPGPNPGRSDTHSRGIPHRCCGWTPSALARNRLSQNCCRQARQHPRLSTPAPPTCPPRPTTAHRMQRTFAPSHLPPAYPHRRAHRRRGRATPQRKQAHKPQQGLR